MVSLASINVSVLHIFREDMSLEYVEYEYMAR